MSKQTAGTIKTAMRRCVVEFKASSSIPFKSIRVSNYACRIVWYICYRLMEIKQRNGALHRIPDVCRQCSGIGYDRPLRGVHRRREKSMHKKALNSCSVSSFTAGIIKGGFYRLSNPNFPNSWWRPVQSHLCCIQGKRLHLGILWHRLCRNSVDCTEGRAIDMHSVAVHSVGICT